MEGLRQTLNKLRTEVDKGASRRKEAETRGKTLLATIKDRDNELESLRERLDLSRRILTLTKKCDEILRAIRVNDEKIELSNEKVEQLGERLGHIERARDSLEARYLNIESQRKSLEAQLDDLF